MGPPEGNSDGGRIVHAVMRDYSAPKSAVGDWTRDLPIRTNDGQNRRTVFTWIRKEDPLQ